ncbi:hypothetical protein PFFCH_00552 [Plasmodium falciparum FCH/4]|uniref:Uncharacterized protein n=1 Tax=Plasmodium falciparum FCH/4 TaxID=1036724 RepID=A0A024VVV3_PLAFA|nr:hypothetical protein PFFCH_00552 [Plasmodium falciparum FCH/4]
MILNLFKLIKYIKEHLKYLFIIKVIKHITMKKKIYLYLLLLLSKNKNKKEVTYMRNYTYSKIAHCIVLCSIVCYTNILYL